MTIERLKHFTKQQMSFDDAGQPSTTPPTTPETPQAQPGQKKTLQEQGIDPWYINPSTGFLSGTSIDPQKDFGITPTEGSGGGLYINRNLLSAQHHEMIQGEKLTSFETAHDMNHGIQEFKDSIKETGQLPSLDEILKNKSKWGFFIDRLKEGLGFHGRLLGTKGNTEHPIANVSRYETNHWTQVIDKDDNKWTEFANTNSNEFKQYKNKNGLYGALLESFDEHLGYSGEQARKDIVELANRLDTSEVAGEIKGSLIDEMAFSSAKQSASWRIDAGNYLGVRLFKDNREPYNTLIEEDMMDEDVFNDDPMFQIEFMYTNLTQTFNHIIKARALGTTNETFAFKSHILQDIQNYISDKFKIPKNYQYASRESLPPIDNDGKPAHRTVKDAKSFIKAIDDKEDSVTLPDSGEKINLKELKTKRLDVRHYNQDNEVVTSKVKVDKYRYMRDKKFIEQEAYRNYDASLEELKESTLGLKRGVINIKRQYEEAAERRDGGEDEEDIQKTLSAFESEMMGSTNEANGVAGQNGIIGLEFSYALSHLLGTNKEEHDRIAQTLVNHASNSDGILRSLPNWEDDKVEAGSERIDTLANFNKKLWSRLSDEDKNTIKENANKFRDNLVTHQLETNKKLLDLVAPDTDYVPIYRGTTSTAEALGTYQRLSTKTGKLLSMKPEDYPNNVEDQMMLDAYDMETGQPPIYSVGTPDYENGLEVRPHSSVISGGSQNPKKALGFSGKANQGYVIASQIPKENIFYMPALSSIHGMESEHESIFINSPNNKSKLLSNHSINNRNDFEEHRLGLIPKKAFDSFEDDNEITKSEVIMKDDKRKPIDIDIPTYHGKSSKEERKASIEAYAKGFKANSEIVREILEENLDS